jgi:DNA-binding MarR family transcriptional regulator
MVKIMEGDLKNKLVHSVFRFKQMAMAFRLFRPDSAGNVSIAEMAVLKGIKDRVFDSGGITIPGLLCISRAAVSQMLAAMEEKGYITRDINQANRRKQSLALTQKGGALVEKQEQKVELLLARIVDRFGEKETEQFIKLSDRFMDIIESIKTEA